MDPHNSGALGFVHGKVRMLGDISKREVIITCFYMPECRRDVIAKGEQRFDRRNRNGSLSGGLFDDTNTSFPSVEMSIKKEKSAGAVVF